MKSIIDRVAARELELFAMNDSDIYFRSLVPVRDNLIRKAKKGVFDQEKAVVAFGYSAEFAAKKYCKEFGGLWYQVFSKATREETAKQLLDNFIDEIM